MSVQMKRTCIYPPHVFVTHQSAGLTLTRSIQVMITIFFISVRFFDIGTKFYIFCDVSVTSRILYTISRFCMNYYEKNGRCEKYMAIIENFTFSLIAFA